MSMTTSTPPDEGRANRDLQVLSTPTTCLHCHLTVQMTYTDGQDEHGYWTCPRCTKKYPAKHWRIKKARRVA